ncbi:MAG: serpin family protein [Chloroflexaceae bacterium]|nr:serpin family protein [Chloroflexaceae bacterium]
MQTATGISRIGLLLATLGVLGSMLLMGCGASNVEAVEVARSEQTRADPATVDASSVATLVQGNTAFAFDLYDVFQVESGNLFYSPYSISTALAMTYAGASGQTADQMAAALSFILPPEQLHPSFNALDQQLNRSSAPTSGEDAEQPFRLYLANSLWSQRGFPIQMTFLDTLALYYGASVRLVDFETQTEESRLAINDWVSQQTEGKIEDLIPSGGLDSLTRLVLANAIYFKADWRFPFDADLTMDGPFTLLDGSEVTVPMMSHTMDRELAYTEGENYQAVAMPYYGDSEMVILLPAEGAFPQFEATLDGATVQAIIDAMAPQLVDLTMPRFSFESEADLAATLQKLGMTDAFDAALADFSGMTPVADLHINAVFHKAFVAVDEKGTEAAAATGVVAGVTSAPLDPAAIVRVDRPFVFLIRDQVTGSVLFVGRVVNPQA